MDTFISHNFIQFTLNFTLKYSAYITFSYGYMADHIFQADEIRIARMNLMIRILVQNSNFIGKKV